MRRPLPGDCAAWPSLILDPPVFVMVLTASQASVEHDVLYTRLDDCTEVMDVSSKDFCANDSGDVLIWRSD